MKYDLPEAIRGGLLLQELQGLHIRKHLRVSSLSNQSLLHRIAKQMHPIKKFWVFSPDFGGRQDFCPLRSQLHLLPGLALYSQAL
jgi:hypothetical protein